MRYAFSFVLRRIVKVYAWKRRTLLQGASQSNCQTSGYDHEGDMEMKRTGAVMGFIDGGGRCERRRSTSAKGTAGPMPVKGRGLGRSMLGDEMRYMVPCAGCYHRRYMVPCDGIHISGNLYKR